MVPVVLKKYGMLPLPFMLPLIIIQLIFAIGGLMNIGTEMILLLYNPSTIPLLTLSVPTFIGKDF